MRKKMLTVLAITSVFYANSQTYNYSSSTGWASTVNLFTDLAGCTHTALPSLPAAPDNIIAINTTSQRVEFTKVAGAHENRISRSLGNIYDKTFNVDFDFNISDDASTEHGVGILPVALTSKNLNPELAIPMTTCRLAPNMDALTVWVGSQSVNTTTGLYATVRIWDNGTLLSNAGAISLSYNTTYYGRVSVYDNETGELIIYSNSNRTTVVGRFCFAMPATVKKLSYLQHATSSLSGVPRISSAWVDNTSVYRPTSTPCCDIMVNGPQVICGESGTYTVTTSGTNVVLTSSAFEGEITQNLNGTFTISNWGSMTGEMPKEVTLTARSICRCEEITASLTVYVYPTLDAVFNFVNLSNNGSQLTNFSAVSTTGGTNVTHKWEMFTSNAMGVAGTLIRGPYSSTGTGSTFAVSATSPAPTLTTGTYYLVRHTMSYEDASCGPYVSNRIVYISNANKMLDLGNVDVISAKEIQQRVSAFESGADALEKRISISPNPTSNKLSVEGTEKLTEVVLIDMNGRTLETFSVNGTRLSINLSGYESGAYFLKITTASGTQLERIVKN